MNLPDDICRCQDGACPRRRGCARWTHRKEEGPRIVHATTCLPDDMTHYLCPYFIEDKEIEKPA